MTQIHVLNGDALVPTFEASKIEGEKIVCRECLIDGAVNAPSLGEFWKQRADFIESTYSESKNSYMRDVAEELAKLLRLSPDDEVYLWFEHDLFCQINLWFVISLLRNSKAGKISVVFPSLADQPRITDSFGGISVDGAKKSFLKAKRLCEADIALGAELWKVYKNSELEILQELSVRESAFPFLREVCQLELERKKNDRPKNALRKIVAEGVTDFREVFRRFLATEAAYGFGDSQVKRMLEQIG